jgi:hypothetical protein
MIFVSSKTRTLCQAASTKVILGTFFAFFGKEMDSKMVTVTVPVNSLEAFFDSCCLAG